MNTRIHKNGGITSTNYTAGLNRSKDNLTFASKDGKAYTNIYGHTTQSTTQGINMMYRAASFTSTLNGVTLTYDASTQTYTATGTATAQTDFIISDYNLNSKAGEANTMALYYLGGTLTGTCYLHAQDGNQGWKGYNKIITTTDCYDTQTHDVNLSCGLHLIRFYKDCVVNSFKFRLQFNKGGFKSWEPYTFGLPSPNPQSAQEIIPLQGDATYFNVKPINPWNTGWTKQVQRDDALHRLNQLPAGNYRIRWEWKMNTNTSATLNDFSSIRLWNSAGNIDINVYIPTTEINTDYYTMTASFEIPTTHVGKFTDIRMYGVGNNSVGATGVATIYDIAIAEDHRENVVSDVPEGVYLKTYSTNQNLWALTKYYNKYPGIYYNASGLSIKTDHFNGNYILNGTATATEIRWIGGWNEHKHREQGKPLPNGYYQAYAYIDGVLANVQVTLGDNKSKYWMYSTKDTFQITDEIKLTSIRSYVEVGKTYTDSVLQIVLNRLDTNDFTNYPYKNTIPKTSIGLTNLNSNRYLGEHMQALEYIESDGTQYIDINVLADNTSGLDFYADVMFTDLNIGHSSWIMGTNDTSNAHRLYMPFVDVNSSVWTIGYGSGTTNTTTAAEIGKRYKIRTKAYGGNQCNVINGEKVGVGTSASFVSDFHILLFAQTYTTATKAVNNSHMRMYEFKMSKNGVLIRHMIPCSHMGKAGMFDLVNQIFYESKSGSFIPGPPASESYKLYNINDNYDIVYNQQLTKNIEEYVMDGSESWELADNSDRSSTILRFSWQAGPPNKRGNIHTDAAKDDIICDRFTTGILNYDVRTTGGITGHSSGPAIHIFIDKNILSSPDVIGFTRWLMEHPTKIIYISNNPKTYHVNQTGALTYDNYTTIGFDNEQIGQIDGYIPASLHSSISKDNTTINEIVEV